MQKKVLHALENCKKEIQGSIMDWEASISTYSSPPIYAETVTDWEVKLPNVVDDVKAVLLSKQQPNPIGIP